MEKYSLVFYATDREVGILIVSIYNNRSCSIKFDSSRIGGRDRLCCSIVSSRIAEIIRIPSELPSCEQYREPK